MYPRVGFTLGWGSTHPIIARGCGNWMREIVSSVFTLFAKTKLLVRIQGVGFALGWGLIYLTEKRNVGLTNATRIKRSGIWFYECNLTCLTEDVCWR